MNKYRNTKTTVDGITFDSKKEAGYYLFLKQKERDGEVSNLRMQVPYELIPAVYEEDVVHLKTKDKVVTRCVQRATHYVADFVYTVNATGEDEVVDVKSYITRRNPEYRLKKKMMLAFNGIKILEV